MIIYVDADAIANIAKELIIKTANRTTVSAIFVANSPTKLPPSPYLSSVVVGSGFDVADNYILQHITATDLLITSDIPLADDAIALGAKVLTSRGEEFTKDNIKSRLNARDFMESLRGTGMLDASQMGGQKPYSTKDKIAFANALNRLVKSDDTS